MRAGVVAILLKIIIKKHDGQHLSFIRPDHGYSTNAAKTVITVKPEFFLKQR